MVEYGRRKRKGRIEDDVDEEVSNPTRCSEVKDGRGDGSWRTTRRS